MGTWGKQEEIIVAIFAVLFGGVLAYVALRVFLGSGVTPDIAAGLAFGVFLAVLGAFGVIAVKADL